VKSAGSSSEKKLHGKEVEMLGEFQSYMREERRWSGETYNTYTIHLREYLDWYSRDPLTATRQDAKAFLRYLNEPHQVRRGGRTIMLALKASSVQSKIAAVSSFYSWLVREGQIEVNPFSQLDLPDKPGKLPKFLTDPEVELLLNYPASSDLDIRDRALISLLDATGVRVSELEGIDLDSIDWQTQRIHVTGKGDEERIVPFGDSCRDNLRMYLDVRERLAHPKEPALFVNNKGYRLQKSGVQYLIRQIGERVLGKDITPHWFRHTCATSMINGGADYGTVADVLGHKQVDTTRRFYAHTAIERTEEEYRDTHPRARKQKSNLRVLPSSRFVR
jgi:integrase/recombinase XerC